MCRRVLISPSGDRYHVRCFTSAMLGLMLFLSIVLLCAGSAEPSFYVSINGGAGLALEAATLRGKRDDSLSILMVVERIQSQ
eukprot:3708085-Prymnesium_polylepis.1